MYCTLKTAVKDTFFLYAVFVLLLATKSTISSHFIALYGRELVFFFFFFSPVRDFSRSGRVAMVGVRIGNGFC